MSDHLEQILKLSHADEMHFQQTQWRDREQIEPGRERRTSLRHPELNPSFRQLLGWRRHTLGPDFYMLITLIMTHSWASRSNSAQNPFMGPRSQVPTYASLCVPSGPMPAAVVAPPREESHRVKIPVAFLLSNTHRWYSIHTCHLFILCLFMYKSFTMC